MNARLLTGIFAPVLVAVVSPISLVGGAATDQSHRVPILIELFTSEGRSTCPPADAFLQKLDEQPVPNAELIVMSEHVDYWNHDGWKDPFSSAAMTDRQRGYAAQFHLETVYTPQMVVDGDQQFSGVDAKKAQAAITDSLPHPKVPVRVSAISIDGPRVHATIETGALDSGSGVKSADIFLVVAQDHAESQVLHGENANRHLTHTAVVRKIARVGKIKPGESFSQQVELKVDVPTDPHNLRVIAFLQNSSSGKVVGATMGTPSGGGPPPTAR